MVKCAATGWRATSSTVAARRLRAPQRRFGVAHVDMALRTKSGPPDPPLDAPLGRMMRAMRTATRKSWVDVEANATELLVS